MVSKKIVALALVLSFLVLPLAFAGSSSAADLQFDNSQSRVGSFTQGSSGSVTVFLQNTTDSPISATVYVAFPNSDSPRLAQTQVTVPGNDADGNPGVAEVSLSFRIDSPGTHWVRVWATYMAEDPSNPGSYVETPLLVPEILEIHVNSSIWSNTSTYIAIVVVILVVAVAVYFLKIRNPSKKNDVAAGTFTAMESRRLAKKQAEAEEDYDDYDEARDDETYIAEEEETAAPAVTTATEKKVSEERTEKAPAAEKASKTEKRTTTEKAPAEKKAEKKEYTGKVSSTKKKQTSPQRKSNPSSRKSSKRR